MAAAQETDRNSTFGEIKDFVMEVVGKIGEDNVPRLASSFSFFGLLSMAPFLVLAVTIGALVLGKNQTAEHLLTQAASVGGPQVKTYLAAIIASSQHRASGVVATLLSLIVTFFSASNLFMNLDDAVNWIWRKKPTASFIKGLITTRILAFFSVVLFGSILLGWLVLDSALGYIAKENSGFKGWEAVSFLFSIVFFTLGFTVTLHSLPRNHLRWHDAVPGGFITAVAFAASKFLLSFYFAKSSGVYTAAGGVVVLLLWMYYSTMIYFFGVEITYVYAHKYGSRKEIANQPPKAPVEPNLQPS